MKPRYYLSIFFYSCTSSITLTSQDFSILTCSRGQEIYSTFGHSAIRYQDTQRNIDWVYNYGLFDFYDPNFIPKFCMGKLDYMVGKESMSDFMRQYVYQQREVKEQILNLSAADRDSLFRFLEWNILDENKYYRYDFLFNNCATKIIDVLEQNCKGLEFKFYKILSPRTFRQHIHDNAKQTVRWIDWGMDLALGMPVDKEATPRQNCFLPQYVYESIKLSSSGGQPLVRQESILIPKTEHNTGKLSDYLLPFVFTFLILALVIYHRFRPLKWYNKFMGIFFILLGIGGLIIGFEWFMTEHSVTKNNWNLLWLNPLFIPYGISVLRNKDAKYLRYVLWGCSIIVFIVQTFDIQEFHRATKNIIFLLFFHFSFLYDKLKKENRNS